MTIRQILKDLKITKYTIHDDKSVTVYQSVNISYGKLTKIPIKFREIQGCFDCSSNHLINLVGAPQIVKGSFDCSYNKLTSLTGAPQKIGGYFTCSWNHLINLIDAPQKIEENFYCNCNHLINIDGMPQIIKGNFYCTFNKLINLDGISLVIINGHILCDEYLYEDIEYKKFYLKKQIRNII